MSTLNKIKLNPCTIYIVLWTIDFVQRMYLSSRYVDLFFYFINLGFVLFCSYKVLMSTKKTPTIRALCVFFVIMLFYGLAMILTNNVPGQDRKSFIMTILHSLGPVFVFYYYSQKGLLNENQLKFWFVVQLVIAFFYFYYVQRVESRIAYEAGHEYEEITNGSTYFFVGLIPFVFLWKRKPILQYLFWAYTFFFLVIGMKRGAIVCGLILFVWFVRASMMDRRKKGRNAIVILLTIITVILAWNFVLQFYNSSDYFQQRYESTISGSSSNRDWIYLSLWQHYEESGNIIHYIFGYGAYYTINITKGFMAHDDWLELLIDCGALGVITYLVFYICFFKEWMKNKPDKLIYSILGACFLLMFSKSIFSMTFTGMTFGTSMIMGYSLSCTYNKTLM